MSETLFYKEKQYLYMPIKTTTYRIDINTGVKLNLKTNRTITRLSRQLSSEYYNQIATQQTPFLGCMCYQAYRLTCSAFGDFINTRLSFTEKLCALQETQRLWDTYRLPELRKKLAAGVIAIVDRYRYDHNTLSAFKNACNVFTPNDNIEYVFEKELVKVPLKPLLATYEWERFSEKQKEILMSRIIERIESFCELSFLAQKQLLTIIFNNQLMDLPHESCVNMIGYALQYVKGCQKYGWSCTTNKEFLRNFAQFKLREADEKDKLSRPRYAAHYVKQSAAFSFQHGNYTIVLPQSNSDIIREGNLMHHCVGSYCQRVSDGQTYIVFVRNISTPTQPYITCQVSLNGTIQQYFLAFDNRISSDEDKEFQVAFQNHLRATWRS